MYFSPSWICTNNTKNLFVKIVYPGGRVELHDEPIIAADVLKNRPKCCVAHQNVFSHPYAVVSSSATLALGQKYYVVPIGTIRKLQLKYSALQCEGGVDQSNDDQEKDGDGNKIEYLSSSCWLMRKNKNGCKGKRVDTMKMGAEKCEGVGVGGRRKSLFLTSLDHWKPGLESIVEEY